MSRLKLICIVAIYFVANGHSVQGSLNEVKIDGENEEQNNGAIKIQNVVRGVTSACTIMISKVAEKGTEFLKKTEDVVGEVDNALRTKIDSFTDTARDICQKVSSPGLNQVDALRDKILELFDALKWKVTDICENVQYIATNKVKEVNNNLNERIEPLKTDIKNYQKDIKNIAVGFVQDIAYKWDEYYKYTLSTKLDNIKESLKNKLEKANSKITSAVKNISFKQK